MLDFNPLYRFVSVLRHTLNSHFYNNQSILVDLIETIRNTIDPVSVEFDILSYSLFIKIKKTAMKKNKGFANTPEFYYNNFIIPVFSEFIKSHYTDIAMKTDPDMLTMVLSNPSVLLNICHITCISDNMLIIKL